MNRQLGFSLFLGVKCKLGAWAHQEGLEGRLHLASQQVVPVDVSKERMSLRETDHRLKPEPLIQKD